VGQLTEHTEVLQLLRPSLQGGHQHLSGGNPHLAGHQGSKHQSGQEYACRGCTIS
jgi:hypothetical protein